MSQTSARGLVYVLLVLSVLFFHPADAQEKKNLRVIDDRILKQAQRELKNEGRLR